VMSKQQRPKENSNRGNVPKKDALPAGLTEDDLEDDGVEENVDETMHNREEKPTSSGLSHESKGEPRVYRPGIDKLAEGEQLEYDSSTYLMYHKLNVEWPCLSFDILQDKLGECRSKFPHTMFMVAGTQTATSASSKNKVSIFKISDLHKTVKDDDPDADDDGDDAIEDPTITERLFLHEGGVNRIRAMRQHPNILATWTDTGKVHVWDIQAQLDALEGKAGSGAVGKMKPLHTFGGHGSEGFAMAWSPRVAGRFLSGDCKKNIHLWERTADGWAVSKSPYLGHTDSVEDLEWSPTEDTVFASCSVDKTIRIWDIREKNKSMIWVAAHKSDVNVIAWNHQVPHLLMSGSDDCMIKIWDLKNFKSNAPAAHYKWHTGPITSVSWHPTDSAVCAVSSDDNQVSVWDMSLEADEEDRSRHFGATPQGIDVPPQLLFIHSGQENIKEIQFHRQIPGVIVSTAQDGFNFFKPFNIDPETGLDKTEPKDEAVEEDDEIIVTGGNIQTIKLEDVPE